MSKQVVTYISHRNQSSLTWAICAVSYHNHKHTFVTFLLFRERDTESQEVCLTFSRGKGHQADYNTTATFAATYLLYLLYYMKHCKIGNTKIDVGGNFKLLSHLFLSGKNLYLLRKMAVDPAGNSYISSS